MIIQEVIQESLATIQTNILIRGTTCKRADGGREVRLASVAMTQAVLDPSIATFHPPLCPLYTQLGKSPRRDDDAKGERALNWGGEWPVAEVSGETFLGP